MTIYELLYIKRISITDMLCLTIAAGLRRINGEDDYQFRLDHLMLTPDEARAYVRAENAEKQKHERIAAFWSGG